MSSRWFGPKRASVCPSTDERFHVSRPTTSVLLTLALLPWLALVAYAAVRVRLPRPLPASPCPRPGAGRSVSIVVPARNEVGNIERCVRSLAASNYPDFEVLVVDDQSDDGTAGAAGAVEAHRARRIRVLTGAPLPEGWFGKPWACLQGARVAEGDLLLFTDADTVHAPELLGRAVAALEEDEADALSLAGRQLMETFWERLLQPQFFALLALRYPDRREPLPRRRWLGAIANGQYILVERGVYEALGGHRVVAGEVVEDLRLAQELVRAGRRLTLRSAEDALATRMYRSLSEVVEGWGKNLYAASQQAVPGWLRPWIAGLSLTAGGVLWLLPPLVVLAAALSSWSGVPVPNLVVVWSLAASAVSVLFWMAASARLGVPAAYGVLYPLSASVAGYIFTRSWIRGSRVRWKGRQYRVAPTSAPSGPSAPGGGPG